MHMFPMNKPRDTASTKFEVDKWIPFLTQQTNRENSNLFGIVLVANWPPKDSFIEPYEKLMLHIRNCFDPQDHIVDDTSGVPSVYIYPSNTIHITIATFTPFFNTNPEPCAKKKELYAQICTEIINRCQSRQDWPKGPFTVEIESAQIGSKAGILLWNNPDQKVERIRRIVQEEYDFMLEENPVALNRQKLVVPNIIHSTFLRFGRVPMTRGEEVQKRFQDAIRDIHKLFGKIKVDSLRLTVERFPYMHIPCDDSHVLVSLLLNTSPN
mmetsp:Transcript_13066/g.24546  ORF Transcript_13066/g.24546 Transcript_13066/m.24546 type:complete len:268 (-) Transcript_13066:209-1012(-)